MILQGSLQMEFNGASFSLVVKTFLKNDIYYFFISDKEKEKPLLRGETIELTYTDSFCASAKGSQEENKNVPPEIISAIQNMLMENKQLWFY